MNARSPSVPEHASAPHATREDLYQHVWHEPMLHVIERRGVSSSFLGRVCTVMNVPSAPRLLGKIEFGKAEPQPPLPDARATRVEEPS